MGMMQSTGAAATVEGSVVRVTYANADTGYSVIRLAARNHDGVITVVGTLPSPTVGERLTVTGQWVDHPTHGRQLRMDQCSRSVPVTVAGICDYLGSGAIPGVGPKTAKRIVSRFGADTLAVMDDQIERLGEIPGIGAKRLVTIADAWAAQGRQRSLMLFLQSHGIGPGVAMRIFKAYGDNALARVRADPFVLASDIRGIGFATADAIAQKLGIPPDAPERLQAGLFHLLDQECHAGHTFTWDEALMDRAQVALDVAGKEGVEAALAALVRQGRIAVDPVHPEGPDRAVYPQGLHRAEAAVAGHWHRLSEASVGLPNGPALAALNTVADKMGLVLADAQHRAIMAAVTGSATIITGGPGTGKTTIVRAIVGIAALTHRRVLLAAPTGRAAKRLSEATGAPAQTIHRLLEFQFRHGGFQRHARRPLDGDLIVVDEASMMDTALTAHLLDAVAEGSAVVLVGDSHQLPSVGPGQVLRDMIDAGTTPVVILTDIFRQAQKSRIVVNAHRIHEGRLPVKTDAPVDTGDFFFIENDSAEAVAGLILHLVHRRIPDRFQVDPVEDIQVLSPMHRGVVGAQALNQSLQATLNPGGIAADTTLAGLVPGDKVMQVRNNYDRELFNGDIGRVVTVDPQHRAISIRFQDRIVDLSAEEADDLQLAYAVTVHKAQGSEYPVVVMPLVTGHYMMLERNLLYTAVTRARRLVVLVGSRKALAMAVNNRAAVRRRTGLRHRLVGLDHPGGIR